MKLTKETLKQIIKEELEATLNEMEGGEVNPDHVRELLNWWWDSDDPANMPKEELWDMYSQYPEFAGLSRASFEKAFSDYGE